MIMVLRYNGTQKDLLSHVITKEMALKLTKVSLKHIAFFCFLCESEYCQVDPEKDTNLHALHAHK